MTGRSLGNDLTAQAQKPFLHGMIVIVSVIDAEHGAGEICDRDITKTGFPRERNIRIQSISDIGFHQSQSALDVFGKVTLLCRKPGQNDILSGKNRTGDLPRGTGDQIAGKLFFSDGLILRHRMFRSADTGDRSAGQLRERKGRIFLLFFYAKRGVDLLIFDQIKKSANKKSSRN